MPTTNLDSQELDSEDILTVAKRLAKASVEAEPEIMEVYRFPNESEIRLIELDPNTTPSGSVGKVEPFYFGSAPASGIPYPSAIALIRPEEKETIEPPEDWGDWSSAERIWPEET